MSKCLREGLKIPTPANQFAIFDPIFFFLRCNSEAIADALNSAKLFTAHNGGIEMPVVTKNYVFGCREPILNADNVRLQMIRAHRYRNKLVELELARRAAADETICRLCRPYADAKRDYQAAADYIDKLYDEIKAASAKARKKVPANEATVAELKQWKERKKATAILLKAASKEAYAILSELQQPFHVEAEKIDTEGVSAAEKKKRIKEQYLSLAEAAGLDAGEAKNDRNSKSARAESGVFWGTYLMIEEACSTLRKGPPPKFKRYEGHGAISVQLQGGLPVKAAMDQKDTRLRLDIRNQEELAVKGKSRGKRAVGIVKMRIGSVGKRKDPVWAEIPVTFHRAIPENGEIRLAYLHRIRVGTQEKWQLRLTIKYEESDRVIKPESRGKMVALHPGWRLMADRSLRVAVWQGSDGETGEIVLSPYLVSGDTIPEGLESVRKKLLNNRSPRFLKWYDENKDHFPAWFLEMTEDIHKWQSQSQYRRLCQMWFAHRLARVGLTRDEFLQFPRTVHSHLGMEVSERDKALNVVQDEFQDERQIFSLLDRWRKRDKHLLEWAANQRRNVILRRKDLYRCAAKKLSEKYETVILSDVNWSDALSLAEPDEVESLTTRQRHYGRLASPGQLVLYTREAFRGSHKIVAGQRMSMDCHVCGTEVIRSDEDRRSLHYTCHKCNSRWDIDVNGAMNQLKRAELGQLKVQEAKEKKPRANRKKAVATA